MQSKRVGWGCVVLVTLLGLVGCGGQKIAEVHGAVTFNGVLIKTGSMTFVPVDGKTSTAGCKIEDGKYTAKVPVGLMKVSISMPKVVGMKKLYDTPNSAERPVTKEALPEKYNEKTELELDVKPGKNQKDWELKSE